MNTSSIGNLKPDPDDIDYIMDKPLFFLLPDGGVPIEKPIVVDMFLTSWLSGMDYGENLS